MRAKGIRGLAFSDELSFKSDMEKPPAYGNEPGFAPQYPPTVNFAQQPTMAPSIIMPVQYGDQSLPITCPHCQHQVVTELSYEAGGLTYLAAFGIALFLWCGCCLIPCCLDSCKDVYHHCPNCKVQLGIHKRL